MTSIYCTRLGETVNSRDGITCPFCKTIHEDAAQVQTAKIEAYKAMIEAQSAATETMFTERAAQADGIELVGSWANAGDRFNRQWKARVEGGYPGAIAILTNRDGKQTRVELGQGTGLIFEIERHI